MKLTYKIINRRRVKYKVLDPDYEQAEIKIDADGTQGLVYLGTDGFDIRDYEKRGGLNRHGNYVTGDTKGKNVRISLNSPLTMTWDEWDDLNSYIRKVRDELHGRTNVLP